MKKWIFFKIYQSKPEGGEQPKSEGSGADGALDFLPKFPTGFSQKRHGRTRLRQPFGNMENIDFMSGHDSTSWKKLGSMLLYLHCDFSQAIFKCLQRFSHRIGPRSDVPEPWCRAIDMRG